MLRLALLVLATPLSAQQIWHAVMPAPVGLHFREDRFRIDSTLTVAIPGHRDGRLERAVDRAIRRLEARTAIPLPRTFLTSGPARLAVVVTGPGEAIPALGEDESYRLEVSAGQATLTAATVVGAIRGLETLLQLQAADSAGFYIHGAVVRDAPRFPWRGLLIDAARHWQPPEVIKRTLDGMAAVKLNVLHWHLTEDQGFRVESRRYPALHREGSDGLYYTQDEIREIVAYAADRGIRVVPEFDMPGHTTSWFVGHPEIATMPGSYAIERRWGVHRPTMDPTRPETWALLEGFIAEMVELFPDRYWHVGGDEVDPNHWNTASHVQAWMRERGIADAHALQTHFNERLFAILARHGRRPVGWDEILQPGLPSGAVIQSWRGTQGLIEATRQGRQAFLSAPYYLDHIKTAAEMYLEDPLPPGLTPEQQRLVLGGEACMWGEYITMETIDSRIWPRMAAIAERFWSPAEVRRSPPNLYSVLRVISRHLTEVGLTHEQHTDRMLVRIAPSEDRPALRALLRYARPRGFGGRGTNQFSPLTRLIDAADPDPYTEWELLMAAEDRDIFALRSAFAEMGGLRGNLGTMLLRQTPLAADGLLLADALADLARIGTQATVAIQEGRRPDAAWFADADSVLARTEGKTFGLLRPVGVAAVRRLVEGLR